MKHTHNYVFSSNFFADIAATSVEQCEQRFQDLKNRGNRDRFPIPLFTADQFITADCTKVSWARAWESSQPISHSLVAFWMFCPDIAIEKSPVEKFPSWHCMCSKNVNLVLCLIIFGRRRIHANQMHTCTWKLKSLCSQFSFCWALMKQTLAHNFFYVSWPSLHILLCKYCKIFF